MTQRLVALVGLTLAFILLVPPTTHAAEPASESVEALQAELKDLEARRRLVMLRLEGGTKDPVAEAIVLRYTRRIKALRAKLARRETRAPEAAAAAPAGASVPATRTPPAPAGGSTSVSLTRTEAPPSRRSPGLAAMLSVLGTFVTAGAGTAVLFGDEEVVPVGLGLISLGLVLGPSVGHFYAGDIGHGFGWAGARVLGYGGSVGLFAVGVEGESWPLIIISCLGALSTFGISMWDIALAADAAEDYNKAHNLTVAPLVEPTRDGATRYGVALGGRF